MRTHFNDIVVPTYAELGQLTSIALRICEALQHAPSGSILTKLEWFSEKKGVIFVSIEDDEIEDKFELNVRNFSVGSWVLVRIILDFVEMQLVMNERFVQFDSNGSDSREENQGVFRLYTVKSATPNV